MVFRGKKWAYQITIALALAAVIWSGQLALVRGPASLVAGVVPQPQAATETIEAPAADAVDTEPPLLLTEEQLKGWVARGFIALPIDTLPKSFHDQFHAVQEAQKRGGGGGRGDRARALGAAVGWLVGDCEPRHCGPGVPAWVFC